MGDKSNKVKIIYIAGFGRSGSTVIANLLSQVSGNFGIGESTWIWHRGFQQDELCGCRDHFNHCVFWKQVIRKLNETLGDLDIHRLIEVWKDATRIRHLADYVLRPSSLTSSGQITTYLDTLKILYSSIQQVSGSEYIVDSSKSPAYAYLLSELSNVDLNIIHLVRNPCAVAFSWTRKKKRPEDGKFMLRHSFRYSAAYWLIVNMFIELRLKNLSTLRTFTRIRYEDFIAEPIGTLNSIMSVISGNWYKPLSPEDLSEPSIVHSISGNPMRFEEGPIVIRPDVEWEANMNWRQTAIVKSITWPLFRQYGYS